MDHHVHNISTSRKPHDLKEVKAILAAKRKSISRETFPISAFENFKASHDNAANEQEVIAEVIPEIIGSNQISHFRSRNTTFANLQPLITGADVVSAKPDVYYGALPSALDQTVRGKLDSHIVPSRGGKPIAPNFFLEVKGPGGAAVVAERQARYNGAIGSRAMHSLQNYGSEEPEYDGGSYTFTSVYNGGLLQIYAHHITPPTEGRRPEYHMTEVKAICVTGDPKSFRCGVTAWRNARDLAKQYRDDFIQAANAKAKQQTGAPKTPDVVIASPLSSQHYTAESEEEDSSSSQDATHSSRWTPSKVIDSLRPHAELKDASKTQRRAGRRDGIPPGGDKLVKGETLLEHSAVPRAFVCVERVRASEVGTAETAVERLKG